jgi:polysaccharide deacetylase family protein (PEP-CTERM system associated)
MLTRSGPELRLGELQISPIEIGARALLTVDVEDWFHANFRSLPKLEAEDLPRRLEPGLLEILDCLDESGARATFFVLGQVAAERADLVKRIADAGHEIACHSLQHELVYEQTPERFSRGIDAARKWLQDTTGQPVWGFRAPSWSITERSLWAFDCLVEAGFRYDSSVFPAASPLYGIRTAPTEPYRIETTRGRTLIEVPPSVLKLGSLRLGVGGGLYLRALPSWVQLRAMRSHARRGVPFMVYIHPRELDAGAWPLRLPLSASDQVFHRLGLRTARRKLRSLLEAGRWMAIGDALQQAELLRAEES